MPQDLDGLKEAFADRYAVERELGRGGMATVYLATDLKHHRSVAIKVLKPELAAALGPDRFLREIEVTAGLHHPHILALYDSGRLGGWAVGRLDEPVESPTAQPSSRQTVELLYYVMPFVEGESLRDRLDRERQLPLEEALRLTREVAEALSYAHSRGVIHRDIKPENILLENGHALVADFGIAKAVTAAGGERLTTTGISIGTPAYMSPEQASGTDHLDGRSDLYSLGCVLYEMLAGHPPFTGTTAHELLARHATDPVPPLKAARDTIPEPIEDAIGRVLAKAPADRFATAEQFRVALELDPAVYRHQMRRRRVLRRVAAVAGIAGLAVLAVLAVWGVTRSPAPAADVDPRAIPLDSTAIAVLPFQVVGADSASPARTLARFMGDLFELTVTGEFGWRIRHPGSVAERWGEAGGTLDSAISEAAELEVARVVGAGRLVRGTVVVRGDSLLVSARMVEVPSGNMLVAPVLVEGTLAEQQNVVDRLVALLVAREAGFMPAEPRLARFKPEALQAYLAGLRAPYDSPEEKSRLRQALLVDSSLVEAALLVYAHGEYAKDTAELRHAWEHQDLLTERGRAYLQVLAGGRHGSIHTIAQKVAAYEALARRWPEWKLPWIELGSQMAIWGPMVTVAGWRERAREILGRLDRPGVYANWHLTELAFMGGDTALIRGAIDRLAADAPGQGGWPNAYRWRLAMVTGDTGEAARALGRARRPWWVQAFAMTDGRWMADADRVADRGVTFADDWGWARGRAEQWREGWYRNASYRSELDRAAIPVYRALLTGVDADSAVSGGLLRLGNLSDGVGDPAPDLDVRTLARCWLTLWRMQHGDTTGARDTQRHIEGHAQLRHRFEAWSWLFEAMLAEVAGAKARVALLRMDSVMRELPLPTGLSQWLPWPAEAQNLMLAQMLWRHGEPERALAAVRRRPYSAPFLVYYVAFPEYLRVEGRLAAIVGDTAGAIKAYGHYLALREDPDPPWRAQWDSVRAELNALLRAKG
jgi:hypothetical protein